MESLPISCQFTLIFLLLQTATVFTVYTTLSNVQLGIYVSSYSLVSLYVANMFVLYKTSDASVL